MASPVSIGDVLALGRLATDIISALRDVGGSSSDFQELTRELESLRKALQDIGSVRAKSESLSPELHGLTYALLTARIPLENFLESIEKFRKHLDGNASSGGLTRAARKVEWAVTRKAKVQQLRDYLVLHLESINLGLLTHQYEAHGVVKKEVEEQRKALVDFRRSFETSNTQLCSSTQATASAAIETKTVVSSLFAVIQSQIVAPIRTVAEAVTQLFTSTEQLCTTVQDLKVTFQAFDPRFLFFQAPVIVEDALGRSHKIPSEFNFGDLDALIQRKFLDAPGDSYVHAKAYQYHNARQRKQVLRFGDTQSLIPGMRILMAFILESAISEQSTCPMPHCGSTTTRVVPGGGNQCAKCNVWFDASISTPKAITNKKRKRKARVVEVEHAPQLLHFQPSKRSKSNHIRRETDDFALFKNVLFRSVPMIGVGGPLARNDEVSYTWDLKRVQICELVEGDLYLWGNGHIVLSKILKNQIRVESDDVPRRVLLECPVISIDGLRKGQDMLIVWTNNIGLNMALRFMNAQDCQSAWENISKVQKLMYDDGDGSLTTYRSRNTLSI